MAKANVSIQNVTSFRDTIGRESEELNRINNDFSNQLNSTSERINVEKEKINSILAKISSGIAKVSAKIEELNAELKELEAELAATPPTITITSTDEDGNTTTEEVPNPAYEALLAQIAQVQEKINQLEEILSLFEELQNRATKQNEMLSQALKKIEELKEELTAHHQQLNNFSQEAVQKLRSINQVLEEYKATKIQTPSLEKYEKKTGGFFDLFKTKERSLLNLLNKTPAFNKGVNESLNQCNPHYDRDVYEYSFNCQRCVPAYEMLRRGYNVTAKPRIKEEDYLSRFPYSVWEEPDVIRTSYNGRREIEEAMEVWGDGARAQIVVAWDKEDNGHTFIAEQKNGKTYFMDPQNGDLDCSHYFEEVEQNSVTFCRIDRLKPSSYIKDCVEEA